MNTTSMRFARTLAFGLLLLASSAHAQSYPNHPIRVVVPFPPGGGGDVLMRPLGKRLSEILGQPIIIDNKGGANGNIGADFVAKAAPDGYTVLLGNSSLPISATLYDKLNFDPVKDLTMISLVSNTPSALVVNPALPVRNMAELIALAKARPGKLNFGSAGSGSTPHLSMEQLKYMAGVDMVHVPYKGSGPAVTAVVAGDVDVLVSNIGTVLSLIQAGKLRAIGVTTATRSAALPAVPPIGETVAGYDSRTWYALMGPANLPAPIVARLNAAINEAVRTPEIRDQLIAMGYEPEAGTPEAMTALFRADIVGWGKVVKTSGATAE
ncbi:tripartite tricarboxylate transporter substrate binding protein [soil metagenome]